MISNIKNLGISRIIIGILYVLMLEKMSNQSNNMLYGSECVFCDIARKKIPAHIIWEDKTHIAFLSIYPNTLGMTVVIPKEHKDSYVFANSNDDICALMNAAKIVSLQLDEKFKDVGRTAVVFEGFGINHLHAKLYPLHGTANLKDNWQPIIKTSKKYFKKYEGYISTHEGQRASEELLHIQAKQLRQ